MIEIAKKMDKDYGGGDSRPFLESLGFVILEDAHGVYKVNLPQGWKIETRSFYPVITHKAGSLEVTTFCGEQGTVLSFLYGDRERSSLTFREAIVGE